MLNAVSRQVRKQIGGVRKRLRVPSGASPLVKGARLAAALTESVFDELSQADGQEPDTARALQYTIGERDRLQALWELIAERLTCSNAEFTAKLMQTLKSSPSERHQDLFALLLTGQQDNGFFVEFGACDGFAASNTYALEKNFGWNGILAEPAKVWHENLHKNRSAKIDERCVSSRTGELLELHEGREAGVSSLNRDHAYLVETTDSYMVPTVSLNDLLMHHDAPNYIDFLSVDCEGHEMEALRDLDFSNYSFGFVCVEQHEPMTPENDVSALFENAGYKRVFPRHPDKTRPPCMQIASDDAFYVPASRALE